jgi:hypothetical protein
VARDEGEVHLLDLPRRERALEGREGLRVLGDDHDARGVLVEPVHDARSQLATHALEIAHVVQQRVDERAALVARARVHHHARSLGHHHEIAIFVEHLEGKRLGHRDRRDCWGLEHHEGLMAVDPRRRLHRAPTRRDVPCLDELLEPRPAQV